MQDANPVPDGFPPKNWREAEVKRLRRELAEGRGMATVEGRCPFDDSCLALKRAIYERDKARAENAILGIENPNAEKWRLRAEQSTAEAVELRQVLEAFEDNSKSISDWWVMFHAALSGTTLAADHIEQDRARDEALGQMRALTEGPVSESNALGEALRAGTIARDALGLEGEND